MTKPDDFSRNLRYVAPPPVEATTEELDVLRIVLLLRRRLWLIAGITVLVTSLALPAILALQPVFYSASRMLLTNPLATTLTSSAEDRLVKLNLTTEVERLMSRDTAARVIEELDLASLPEFNPALREESTRSRVKGFIARALFGAEDAPAQAADSLDAVLPEFFAGLDVATEPASDVVRIGFRSLDPDLAANVPNTLLHVYLDERQAHLADEVSQAHDWIDQRIAEQHERVAAATKAVDDYARQASLNGKDPSEGVADQLATLGTERTGIARTRASLAATAASIDLAATVADKVMLADSPTLAALGQDLQKQQNELDRLLRSYGDAHEQVIAARTAIADTAAQLDAEIGRYVQSLKSRIVELDREDKNLAADVAAARATLARRREAEAQRADLQRQVDAEKEAVERLEAQRRTLTAEGKLPVADVEMLSPATVPLSSTGRGKAFYLAAAIVFGGMLGVTAACLVEMLDRSVRSHEQLRGLAGIVPVGMVPRLPRRLARLSGLAGRSDPMFAGAVRGLMLALERASDGRLPASVLVTSPLPAEGKTVVAAALALEILASGHPVLLVDGDIVHGRLHDLLGLGDQPGLTDLVAGRLAPAELVRTDEATGFAFIPRGAPLAAPVDREVLATLLAYAKETGRTLILDSAPVLGSSDTTAMAGAVERTIVVTRWGRTVRNALEAAIERLDAPRQERLAVVINMVEPRRHALYGFKDAALFSRSLRRYQYARF